MFKYNIYLLSLCLGVLWTFLSIQIQHTKNIRNFLLKEFLHGAMFWIHFSDQGILI